ncbi:MAG: LamG domain-containing protein [Pirellulaceae bacterium]|nr:LamG domain-containing protein [Pirellulaceae bacterium]
MRFTSTCVLSSLLALGMIAVGQAGTYSDLVIADGAINYWSFEQASTADPATDSAGSVDGTYQGNVVLAPNTESSLLGNAAQFDGQDGTHVALGAGTVIGDSITVEAWVNLDVDATAGFSPVLAKWDGSFELDVNATDQPGLGTDRVDFVLRNSSNDFGDPASPIAISRGEWHHVAGVYDGTTGEGLVYLDGVAGAPFSLGGALQNAGGDDGNWYIGTTRNPASGFNWDGWIDEVAVYDKALSAETIQSHINAVPEPTSVSLLLVGLLGVGLLRRKR